MECVYVVKRLNANDFIMGDRYLSLLTFKHLMIYLE